MSILDKFKPLDATGQPIDGGKLYVCVESHFAGESYAITREGMKLRGSNDAVQRGSTFFVVADSLDDDEIRTIVDGRNDAARSAAAAQAVKAEREFTGQRFPDM